MPTYCPAITRQSMMNGVHIRNEIIQAIVIIIPALRGVRFGL